ncbi:MAG TPA: kelch repeat-containing protein, partial [Ktedonobacteraceae bacterium]|nr:kelch repeat-containing protein [Ktedonobacteraceae bacterium]
PLSLQRVLAYVEQAADALYYAHQRGLIHLDVKPANLLLDAQDRLMLADFGVSVLLEGYTHASLHYYVGTPLYTAPEQWLEQPRTASDQYALAVTCYQLLVGRPPFTGNLYAVMHGHLQASPPPMSTFNPLMPAQVEKVLERALAKDPNERYPDIRAFAMAFREAVENAANADTDTQMQQRAMLLLEQNTDLMAVPPVPDPAESETEDHHPDKKAQPEPGTFREQHAEREQLAVRSRTAKRGSWLRALLLCMLALVLIAGGSLGFVRSQRPCWLGICPQIALSTHALTLTNDATQVIEITNTGTDTLNWVATPRPHTSWLSLSATNGSLAPGRTARLTLKTQVDHLGLDPDKNYTYTDMIDISGGPGVASQSIEVTENVVKELQAVSVTTSGKTFLYAQGKLQPARQTITITNHSGHTLSWFSQYTDNNWLSVLPGQGILKDKQSINLTVTVENPQMLPNDTYQVLFSLVGQLDNQEDFTLLQTIDFSLQVSQSQVAQTVPTVPAVVTPTAPAALAFSAQPVDGSGAPGGPRFNHSMVWDTQDGQLLVFGGSNGKGDLLNDLWSFNPANNSWTNLTPLSSSPADCSGSSPAPRMNAAMVWDSADQEVLLYGGVGSASSYLGDLWSFSPASNTWKALACTGNGPGARGEAGVAWNGSQMLLLGGLGSSGSLADFWAYTPGSGWSQISASTPLGARTYPTMAWDSHDKQLFVFGGLSANGSQLGDFYSYQSNGGWRTIEASNGSAPMARQQAFSTWDSKQQVFLLMGGWQASTSTAYSALWAYSPAENAWWQITSLHNSGNAGVIPSRMASAMVWDSADNRAYIYAGSSGINAGAMSDLWMIVPR